MRIDKATAILEGKYSGKKVDKMDGFIDLWKEAQRLDEQDRNSTSNNFDGW